MNEIINDRADWQWNVNSWSKQDSPAAAITEVELVVAGEELTFRDRCGMPES
ncbi:hypothetical protein AB0N07_51670 [Streptomyces sp. NPDC051172]|uniref:hypothetical protein n=1 Tax=Streptomyces sp. NPDC051172 TaxID=3155796 RepID=UPI003414C913